MTTNKRPFVNDVILISACKVLLPSGRSSNKKIAAFNTLWADEDQRVMLAAVLKTIFSITDTLPAKKVSAHVFALQMLNDCYAPADRNRFMKGLQQFNHDVQKRCNKVFSACTALKCQAIVAAAKAVSNVRVAIFLLHIRLPVYPDRHLRLRCLKNGCRHTRG